MSPAGKMCPYKGPHSGCLSVGEEEGLVPDRTGELTGLYSKESGVGGLATRYLC